MRIVDHSAEFKRRLDVAMEKVLRKTSAYAVRAIRKDMRQSAGGVPKPAAEPPIYGWVRTRSAPGDSPAVQTGKLYRSIQYAMMTQRKFRVGTGSKVGRWTQYGTRGGRMISPVSKPYLVFRHPSGRLVRTKGPIARGTVEPRPWLSLVLEKIPAEMEGIIVRTRL